jgi:hypothetical protein
VSQLYARLAQACTVVAISCALLICLLLSTPARADEPSIPPTTTCPSSCNNCTVMNAGLPNASCNGDCRPSNAPTSNCATLCSGCTLVVTGVPDPVTGIITPVYSCPCS